jgi:hypothetical protein
MVRKSIRLAFRSLRPRRRTRHNDFRNQFLLLDTTDVAVSLATVIETCHLGRAERALRRRIGTCSEISSVKSSRGHRECSTTCEQQSHSLWVAFPALAVCSGHSRSHSRSSDNTNSRYARSQRTKLEDVVRVRDHAYTLRVFAFHLIKPVRNSHPRPRSRSNPPFRFAPKNLSLYPQAEDGSLGSFRAHGLLVV